MGQRKKIAPQTPVGQIKEAPKQESEPIPKKSTTKNSTQQGLAEGHTRTTIVIPIEDLEKLRTIAFINKKEVSYYIRKGATKVIEEYEQANGPIPRLR